MKLKQELHSKEEKLKKAERELEVEKKSRKMDQETIQQLEMELAELRSNQTRPHLQPAPHSSGVRSNAALTSSEARQGTVERSQIGAVVIELFDQTKWTVSENVFTKSREWYASLVSFEFGAVVARLSLTIRKGPSLWFTVGLISSKLSNQLLTEYLPTLKGGAGWELHATCLYTMQNGYDTSNGDACLGGREGQRVVIEADGREGKRTLTLSRDGMTQHVSFTDIPVPLRFAVNINNVNDAVEIESLEIVSEPQMVGETLPCSTDCSPFLNWSEDKFDTDHERTVVYQSLVATLKLQHTFDHSLEAKAVKFLKSVTRKDITTASMEMFHYLIQRCSLRVNFALVKADILPQLIITLNPLDLSLTDFQKIHTCLIYAVLISFCLATPGSLANLEIEDDNEQQAVHEIVLKQVLAPSEQYICHLCMNRFSIINGEQSSEFVSLLARLLQRYPSFQHTMDIFLVMPVQELNAKCEETQQNWKNVQRMLRMEGIEDVFEEKLRNDRKSFIGAVVVATLFDWNNIQGMNLPTHL
ncbi:hypothetical protein BLNAU_22589 [Blattamonas nauphoetae]|uniref:MATH domain-containing protein n=1 Tax=Blattamonas nauphoetae TaxID=2049346 RepID=A0ABQ9WT31_9EUKA|nr:hypothetical protein BLNAU_22589 [Blattamonas nauphoetae]